jgi:hypothetical protein
MGKRELWQIMKNAKEGRISNKRDYHHADAPEGPNTKNP